MCYLVGITICTQPVRFQYYVLLYGVKPPARCSYTIPDQFLTFLPGMRAFVCTDMSLHGELSLKGKYMEAGCGHYRVVALSTCAQRDTGQNASRQSGKTQVDNATKHKSTTQQNNGTKHKLYRVVDLCFVTLSTCVLLRCRLVFYRVVAMTRCRLVFCRVVAWSFVALWTCVLSRCRVVA